MCHSQYGSPFVMHLVFLILGVMLMICSYTAHTKPSMQLRYISFSLPRSAKKLFQILRVTSALSGLNSAISIFPRPASVNLWVMVLRNVGLSVFASVGVSSTKHLPAAFPASKAMTVAPD